MHKLKEFVDHRFKEFPMSPEEARILSNDIHNIGSNDRLVILATFLLAKTQQLLKKKTRVIQRVVRK